jgi:hypothetical protein
MEHDFLIDTFLPAIYPVKSSKAGAAKRHLTGSTSSFKVAVYAIVL